MTIEEVPNEDVKTLIDSPTWRNLTHDIASILIDSPTWRDKYTLACNAAEKMIGKYFVKDEDDL